MCEVVLRLVWRTVDLGECDDGTMAGCRFLLRPYTSLIKNAEIFSRRRFMVLERKGHRWRPNEVGGRERCGWSRPCVR